MGRLSAKSAPFAFPDTEGKGDVAGTLANPSPELAALFGVQPTAAGARVTPENALRCPAVYACVKVIAEAVAQLPLHVFRRQANGGRDRADDHALSPLFSFGPNAWTSWFEFALAMQTALLLHGNAYAYVNRVGDKVIELLQIDSRCVSVRIVNHEPVYDVTEGGVQKTYSAADIFHLKTLGCGPYVGLSPIMQAREAIGLAMALEEHAGRLCASGARPSGVLKYGKPLGESTLKKLRGAWDATHSGSANAGKTLILEDGMDWEAVQFSSVDLQFQEMRRFQILEICRIYRLPPTFVQDLERATFSNVEELGEQFLSFTLMPWLKLWEGAITKTLIGASERGNVFAEFLVDDLARANLAARFEAYSKALGAGGGPAFMAQDEIRRRENLPPEGGAAASLPVPTNVGGSAAPDPKPALRVAA